MKFVIQCAAGKRLGAGRLMSSDGRPVEFRARPDKETESDDVLFAHPDDLRHDGTTWREYLTAYNRSPGDNPLGLLPAYELYRNATYRQVVERVGATQVMILSAGWGLIPSSFLTPYYDITFSRASPAKKRTPSVCFRDYRIADHDDTEPLTYFGGSGYWELFAAVTAGYRGPRVIVYATAEPPDLDGVAAVRYERTFTNWYYVAVKRSLDGEFEPRGLP